MILLSARCSMMWALQPEARAITNSGVNMAVGTPIKWYETALNQSRLANIFLVSPMTCSMRSAVSNIFMAPASAGSA